MVGLARLLVPSMLLALFALAPASAHADLKAKTSVTTKSGATRIVTKLSSDKSLGDRQKPRKVKVKGGGETYKLGRVGGASAARVSLGTWKSEAYRGDAAEDVLALVGERVKVVVKSLAGTTKLRSKVAGTGSTPPPGTDPPPGTEPTEPESGDITGQAAIDTMEAELTGMYFRNFSSSDSSSTSYHIHWCPDDAWRTFRESLYSSSGFSFNSRDEYLGNPWNVTEALIRQDGSRYAVIRGVANSYASNEGPGPVEGDPNIEVRFEFQNGQWYWAGEAAQAFPGEANCQPVLDHG